MDEIPGPLFILAGIGIALYSTFIALRTDFTRFVFFFIAAIGLIGWGVVKIVFAKEQKKQKKLDPYASPAKQAPAVIDQRRAPLQQPNYRQSAPQRIVNPIQNRPLPQTPQQIAAAQAQRRYPGFYHGQQQPQRSRFHDAVRRQ